MKFYKKISIYDQWSMFLEMLQITFKFKKIR